MNSPASKRRVFAIYGKGGIGKSTVVSNLTYLFRQAGDRVLQIGFDPKADSSQLHVEVERIRPVIPEFLDRMGADGGLDAIGDYIIEARTGVHCIEIGGPEPGIGCAGVCMTTTMRVLDMVPGFFERYDTVVFDVLGDVVCGGFSGPLRKGRASEVYVIVSGDVASVYAANNIIRAIRNHEKTGTRLGGLIANRVMPTSALQPATLHAFAERVGSRVVHTVPADPQVELAALEGGTAVELFPEAEVSTEYRRLYERVRDIKEEDRVVPKPMDNQELFRFLKEHRRLPAV